MITAPRSPALPAPIPVGDICEKPGGALHHPTRVHMDQFALVDCGLPCKEPRFLRITPPGTTHTMYRSQYIEIDRSTERRSRWQRNSQPRCSLTAPMRSRPRFAPHTLQLHTQLQLVAGCTHMYRIGRDGSRSGYAGKDRPQGGGGPRSRRGVTNRSSVGERGNLVDVEAVLRCGWNLAGPSHHGADPQRAEICHRRAHRA